MRWLTRIIDFFLYTSLFTTCCAIALCMATERLINGILPPLFGNLHMLIFGGTMLVYNAPRIMRKAWPDERKHIFASYRFWYFASFIAGVLITMSALVSLSWHIIAGCLVLGLFALTYSLPLLPFRNRKRLREFGWLKILVLTCVWTTVTSVLPMLYWNKPVTQYPYEILLRFVFIFILCIIFDIRDVRIDQRNNIATLPHKLGLKNSYRLIDAMLILFSLLSVIQYFRQHTFERLLGALITAIVTRLVVVYLQKRPTDRAYMGLADGVMLVYASLVLLPFPA